METGFPALRPLLGAALALAAVLGLISLTGLAARRFRLARIAAPNEGAITLQAVLALDSKRRLFLVEIAGARALILAGGEGESMQILPPAT